MERMSILTKSRHEAKISFLLQLHLQLLTTVGSTFIVVVVIIVVVLLGGSRKIF
jgi:hypothetical protein